MGPRWRQVSPYAVPALVFLAVVLVLFWHVWIPYGGWREFGIDSQWEYWGDLQFQLDAYRHGSLPLWNPWDRCGYPFHADPQAGIFYPLTWGLLAIGAVIRDTPFWLIDLKNMFHFWLAAVGMYAYLRWRGLPKGPAYAAGILTIICSPWLHHVDLALNWSMAYAPWALLAVEACAARPTAGKGAALALVLGLSFLAGAPPCFWYLLCAVIPVGIWAVVHHGRQAPAARAYLVRLAGVLGLAGGLFALMVVGQALATAALLPNTVRVGKGVEFALATQFNKSDLLGFFVPRVTRLNQYLGALAIFAMIAAVVLRPTGRTWVLVGIIVASVICCFGSDGYLLRWLATALPPFRYFRYAFRYTYVALVAVPILVAEGLAALAELPRRHWSRWLLLGAGLAGAVALAVAAVLMKGDARVACVMGFAAYATVAPLLFGLVTVTRPAWLLALAPLVLMADNLVAHADAVERNLLPHVDVSRDGKLAELEGVPLDTRIYDRSWLKYRPGLRNHVRDFAGYEDDPLALERYATVRDTLRARPRDLGYANVRYLLEEGQKVLSKSPADTAALVSIGRGLWKIPAVAPEVAWFPRAELAPNPFGALQMLMKQPPGQLAVLEKATLPADVAARLNAPAASLPVAPLPAPVNGQLVALEPNQLTARVEAPAAGVVVISEAFYPGWTATVDGEPADIYPANAMFRGVLVGPGSHVIEMTYHAPLFIPLAVVEVCALAAALVLIWRERRPARMI